MKSIIMKKIDLIMIIPIYIYIKINKIEKIIHQKWK